MTHRDRPGWLAAWLLAVALLQSGPDAPAAEKQQARADDRMAEVIASVRAQEARYRDIEYVVKITTRQADPRAPDRPADVKSIETRQVVLQGDRIYFRKDVHERVLASRTAREEISAYDGERTRTVVAGNCANIHLGRFEHPDVSLPHVLALDHDHVNFPLSAYLGGTKAIHAHPKYPRFDGESGSVHEFTRVETDYEGEEVVDGLRCAKIRVKRWYLSRDEPWLQYLWLARERNFFCVKEQVSWPKFGDVVLHEMRVDRMQEVAPGRWFPMKLTVIDYDADATKLTKKPVVTSRTETVVEKVDLAPRHDDTFFRDVAIPAGLPVFTIQDRALVGSTLPEPVGGKQEAAKLAEVATRVAEQERRYRDLEVEARVEYRYLGAEAPTETVITEKTQEEHSILRTPLAYYNSRLSSSTLGGERPETLRIKAFDGSWTRSLSHNQSKERNEFSAFLRKVDMGDALGRRDRVPVHRPHVLMLRDDGIHGPLADLLISPWYDRINRYRLRFRYCGEEKVDGHPCIRLRGDIMTGKEDRPQNSIVLFLAVDRNLIPIRMERYGGNSGSSTIPTGVSRCEDLREIAPGTWYPFRVVEIAFDSWIPMAQGRILLNWRREYRIESVVLAPRVDDDVFRGAPVPEGTKVHVLDEEGKPLGEIEQLQEGASSITPERYEELKKQARARDEQERAEEEKRARERAKKAQ